MSLREELDYIQSFMSENRVKRIREVLDQRTKHFTVVIEDIYQAHNASAVVRTCDVFGLQNIYATERIHGLKISHHVAKGADKWIDLKKFNQFERNNNLDAIAHMRSMGYQIVATSPHHGSCSPSDFDVTAKSAFFFGAEKEGLSKDILDNADAFIRIPMYGFTESLNISVSAAIILQNLIERLKKSDVDWGLSQEEKLELEYRWSMLSVKDSKKLIEIFKNRNI